jgi:hypothetical protein
MSMLPLPPQKSTRRVLAVGDVNVDLILTGLSRIPQSEQEALATGYEGP